MKTSQDSSIYFALDTLIFVLTTGVEKNRKHSLESRYGKDIRDSIAKSINEFVRSSTLLLPTDGENVVNQTAFRSVISPDPSAVGKQLCGLERSDSFSFQQFCIWQIGLIAELAVRTLSKSEVSVSARCDIAMSTCATYWVLNYVAIAKRLAADLNCEDEAEFYHDSYLLSVPEKLSSRSINSGAQLRSVSSKRSASKQHKEHGGCVDYGFIQIKHSSNVSDIPKSCKSIMNTELWLWSCSASDSFLEKSQAPLNISNEELLRYLRICVHFNST